MEKEVNNNLDNSSISEVSIGSKPVAIYCRVSTENQENDGTSLDTQREACLKYCQEHNYKPTNVFIETWSGLSLERPKLDELRQLVRNSDVTAVVIYSLDRLTRTPNDGVILRQEREKHHVDLLCVTETVDSSKIGQLIQYIYDYASSLEADRLRDRMMRGTKARVFDKKLPVTHREPYGYRWAGERQLEPNSDYDTAKLILDLAIDGKSYDYIISDLKRRGIKSPTGLDEWNKHTISSIIRNPVYCGKYYAFKSEVVAPKKRNGNTYGKTSVKRLPIEKWQKTQR
jgi:site-specific DNA recombinase